MRMKTTQETWIFLFHIYVFALLGWSARTKLESKHIIFISERKWLLITAAVISSKQKSKAFFFIVSDKSVRIQYYPNSVPSTLLNKMTNIRQLISIARRRKLWIWSNQSFLPFHSPFLTIIKGTRLQINSIKFHFTPW